MKREFHPAAEIFPIMPEDELQELANDMKANGQQHPIELLDGKIIDGRNRYLACEIAKKTPRVCHVKGIKDPVAYVLSKNLHRRHLTISQRAMIAARARELYEEEAKERQKQHGGTAPGRAATNTGGHVATSVSDAERQELMRTEGGVEPEERQAAGKARDQAGQALGVSGKSVDRATKVLKKGSKKLVKEVDAGKITVAEAAKAIDEEAEPPVDVPKDADGVPIPEHLRAIFAAAENFEKTAGKVSVAKGALTAAVNRCLDAWDNSRVQKWSQGLRDISFEIEESRPYLVCPRCNGNGQKDCPQCQGKGWPSRDSARTVPIEDRNEHRQAAGLDLLVRASQQADEITVPAGGNP